MLGNFRTQFWSVWRQEGKGKSTKFHGLLYFAIRHSKLVMKLRICSTVSFWRSVKTYWGTTLHCELRASCLKIMYVPNNTVF
jgi:hypothetical protein